MPCVTILIVQNFQEVLSLLLYLNIRTLFLRQHGFHFFYHSLNRKIHTKRGGFDWKPFVLIHVSSSWSYRSSKKNLDLSRFPKSKSSKTTGLISPIKDSMEKLNLVWEKLIKKSLSFIFTWESAEFENCC